MRRGDYNGVPVVGQFAGPSKGVDGYAARLLGLYADHHAQLGYLVD
jgi:hypothetical protein